MPTPVEAHHGVRHRGIDLIYERKRAGVQQDVIARRMGVSRQYVSRTESRVDEWVSPEFWSRYMAAIDAETDERSEADDSRSDGAAPANP